MSKRASLKYQFITSIKKCFKENLDKRSLKIQKLKGKMTEAEERAYNAKVWSYGYRNNLIKFVKSFINWMKEKGFYEEYKYAYELDGEIFSLYLRDLRLNKRNSYATMKTYESYIQKLEHIMNYTLPNYEFDYTSDLNPVNYRNKSKLRVYSLNKAQYLQLIKHILQKTCNEPTGNDLGILLTCAFGMRAHEVCNAQFRDFLTLEEIQKKGEYKEVFYISPYDSYMRIKGKGGDIRYIPVVFQWQYTLVKYIQNLQKKYGLKENYYISSLSKKKLSDDGFRKQLRKRMDEIGIHRSAPTSSHMVRKTWSKLMLEYYKKHPENIIKEHTKYFQNS